MAEKKVDKGEKKPERKAEKKEQSLWARILFDYRVMALIVVLLLATIFLLVYPPPEAPNATNLKFGLDFEGGSWLKLLLINNSTISDEQLQQTKDIMQSKINNYGLKDVPINTVRDDKQNAYILIDFAGISEDEARKIVGTPGLFEMRIQSTGNESEHILYGKDVEGSDVVTTGTTSDGQNAYAVSFRLSREGGEAFHEVASKYDILHNPDQHQVIMLLDGKEFHRAPISNDPRSNLAQELINGPVYQMRADTGVGKEGYDQAHTVWIHMQSGALPFNVETVSSGQVPAEQGATFKTVAIVAALLAQAAIGVVMYVRYKEPRIILPMFLTSLFEIFILLGFASAPWHWIGIPQWEIDLPSVAAIIAVIGTGIDQLIIITDEVMTTGKTPTAKKILQRMGQAMRIIFASAATVVVAMIPLYFMGFGSLRGFALTTIVGVAIGIFITRPAYGKIISEILNA